MQQGEILRHRQGENKFLVVFQQQMPFREISQNQSSHFQVYFSICQNMKQHHLKYNISSMKK